MNLNLQFKIKQDPIQQQFLREYSYWYKYLNRSELYYKEFINDMKNKYKLRTTDKLNKVIEDINMFSSFLDVLK